MYKTTIPEVVHPNIVVRQVIPISDFYNQPSATLYHKRRGVVAGYQMRVNPVPPKLFRHFTISLRLLLVLNHLPA